MEAQIDVRTKSSAIDLERTQALIDFLAKELKLSETSEVSISFVNSDEICELNRSYRGIDSPTDVLSFECDNINDGFPGFDDYVLGDVIIAPEVAVKQAQEHGVTVGSEIDLLTIHGVLHLMGYDHVKEDDALRMEAFQDSLLAKWESSLSRSSLDDFSKNEISSAGFAERKAFSVPVEERMVHHNGDDAPFTLVQAFKCAFKGIGYAFKTQRNFHIHIVFAALAIIFAALLQVSLAGWLAIVLCISIVFSLEMLNTSIESVVDMVSPDWHELAMRAKDCAAGAVLISALFSLVVAAIVFIPRIIEVLFA